MMITSDPTHIAIVIEGGMIQDVLLEGCGADGPLPKIVVVDCDIGRAPGVSSDVKTIVVKGKTAWCYIGSTTLYETAPSGTLRPRYVFDQIDRFERTDRVEQILKEIAAITQGVIGGNSQNGEALLANVKAWLPTLRQHLSDLGEL